MKKNNGLSSPVEQVRRAITTLVIAITVAFMLSINQRSSAKPKISVSSSSPQDFFPDKANIESNRIVVNLSTCEAILEDAFLQGTQSTMATFAMWRATYGAPGDAVRLCLSSKLSSECPEQIGLSLDTISWLSTDISEALAIEPKHATHSARLIAAHGGGFVCGSAARYLGPILFGTAERASINTYVVEYDLAPNSLSALDQMIDIYDKTNTRNDTFIAVLGDSAGGALAAGLALSRQVSLLMLTSPMLAARQWATRFFYGYCNLSAQIPISGSKHITPQGLAYVWGARFAMAPTSADTLRADPNFAPFEASDSALRHLANHTIIISSDNDPLRFEARLFADRLGDLGASVEFVNYNDLAHDPILRSRALWEAALIKYQNELLFQ
uniref:Alpha/beta hydrolase fold-3 domain-containing protein n=1 Tax=Aureoumbra lagunensis TaxID=44058 RepID=A0A7S3K6I4_9STRA